MAAFGFAERGWPAGRIPTTREIVLSMIERSAWRYVTDVQAELEAGEWTEYASSVRERERTYPLSELYDDHNYGLNAAPSPTRASRSSTSAKCRKAAISTTGPTRDGSERAPCEGACMHFSVRAYSLFSADCE